MRFDVGFKFYKESKISRQFILYTYGYFKIYYCRKC